MPNIIKRPGWYIPEKLVTPEKAYRNRRAFLRQMSLAGVGLMAGMGAACSRAEEEFLSASGAGAGTEVEKAASAVRKGYPFPRNPEFDPKWRITGEDYATGYNNFYEFGTSKSDPACLTELPGQH